MSGKIVRRDITKTVGYTCTDGTHFVVKSDAIDHQLGLDVAKWYNDPDNSIRSYLIPEVEVSDFINWILDNGTVVKNILTMSRPE